MSLPAATAFGEPLLDARQLAETLGVHIRWVYRQAERERGALPSYKLNRQRLFEAGAVRAWLAGQREGVWPEQVSTTASADETAAS